LRVGARFPVPQSTFRKQKVPAQAQEIRPPDLLVAEGGEGIVERGQGLGQGPALGIHLRQQAQVDREERLCSAFRLFAAQSLAKQRDPLGGILLARENPAAKNLCARKE
jgi:hypothetical protein